MQVYSLQAPHGISAFRNAIEESGKNSDPSFLILLRSSMFDQRVECTIISFSSTIAACETSSQWEHAVELLDWSSHEGLRLGPVGRGLWVDWRVPLSLIVSSRRLDLKSWSELIRADHWQQGSTKHQETKQSTEKLPLNVQCQAKHHHLQQHGKCLRSCWSLGIGS